MTKRILKTSTCALSRILLQALIVATPAIAQEPTTIIVEQQGYWNEARQCFRERPYWLKDQVTLCDDDLLRLDNELRQAEKNARK